jgi:hypothetical protein
MLNPKCQACGLVNFASAETCKRCEASLFEQQSTTQQPKVGSPLHSQASAPKASAAPGRILLKPVTINGTGVDLMGYRQLTADTYQVTRCITLLNIPLIPISTWVIRPINRELSTLTTRETFNFEVLEDKGLIVEDVLCMYGSFLLWGVLAFGPFALSLMLLSGDVVERDVYGERVAGGPSTFKLIQLILFLLSMPWCIGLLIWLKRRRDKIYTLTKKNWFARLLGVR